MCILIKILFQQIHIMRQTSQNKRQPEPKEIPEDILVKDGKQCNYSHQNGKNTTKSNDLLKFSHKPVTFFANTIEKDTAELNKTISDGYFVQDSIRTETGIIYVLTKWEKRESTNLNNDAKVGRKNETYDAKLSLLDEVEKK